MASKHDGAASYSNIVTLGESPLAPGIVWVGTNDGNVQVSRDGGATWKNVVDNIINAKGGVPPETHVSRVEPSAFDAGTCYVSFDGHRTDDHKPYVFVTRDFGQTWASLAANLPVGNVNVIKEDPKNRNLLYVGTEYGFYVSLTGGKDWKRFMTGLPTVRIDDVLVHPRDNDLVLGTHGRSIWIIDDITPLQQMTDAISTTDAHLFEVRKATAWVNTTASIDATKLMLDVHHKGRAVVSSGLRASASCRQGKR
jgi:ligand-binding sensor domain-containing protein